MENRDKSNVSPMSELAKNREAITQLAQSGEAQRLFAMLRQQGGVHEAAKAAAEGDTGSLVEMVNRLMNTKEGAQLVERIGEQAKRSGLQ